MLALKRPDSTIYFFPVLGFNMKMKNDLKAKGDTLASLKEYKKLHKDAKFEISNLGTNACISLRDPEYIKDFAFKPTFYHKHHLFRLLKELVGNGLAVLEGDHWKQHRKIVSSTFSFEFLKNNIQVIQSATEEILNKITPADFKDYPVIDKMQEITGEIVGRIFFGEHLNNYVFEDKPLTLALAEISSELAQCATSLGIVLLGPSFIHFPLVPKYAKVMKRVTEIRKVCLKIVQERKVHPKESSDLLSILLKTQNSEFPEQRLSDVDIADEFITFFIAGMDTTGHLIGMALYQLTQYPEYLQELKEERDKTFNTEKIKTIEILQKMDELHAFLKETLRFYNPAPGITYRVAQSDHKIVDLDIKKGDVVRADPYAVYHDEKTYEKATQFHPKRWNDDTPDIHLFIPFSTGPRNCIGQHLAILEAKYIVSEFLERFDFKAKENYKLRMTWRFTYEPLEEILLDLTPKKSLN